MTVIATLITGSYTAHATDSFLTIMAPDGSRKVIEDKKPKIVRVRAFRGALAYWGLARFGTWSTLDWLQQRAKDARSYTSAEEFALDLTRRLNSELDALKFKNPLDKGMGIHFTAYEQVSDYWIPELFHIRNWTDPSYSALFPSGFVCTRETYATLTNVQDRPDSHREAPCRLAVHHALQSQPLMLRFNNGDPVLFNPIANALLDAVQAVMLRGHLRPSDDKFHLSLVRRPVQVVSELLADVSKPNMRVIGGKPHDLAIDPNGNTTSTTGD